MIGSGVNFSQPIPHILLGAFGKFLISIIFIEGETSRRLEEPPPEAAEKLSPNTRSKTTGTIIMAARIFHRVLSLGCTGVTISSCTVGSGCAHFGHTVQSGSTGSRAVRAARLELCAAFGAYHILLCDRGSAAWTFQIGIVAPHKQINDKADQ